MGSPDQGLQDQESESDGQVHRSTEKEIAISSQRSAFSADSCEPSES
jgi:hypothetical protein